MPMVLHSKPSFVSGMFPVAIGFFICGVDAEGWHLALRLAVSRRADELPMPMVDSFIICVSSSAFDECVGARHDAPLSR
eukprot:6485195-Prymnesium_polylepis.1